MFSVCVYVIIGTVVSCFGRRLFTASPLQHRCSLCSRFGQMIMVLREQRERTGIPHNIFIVLCMRVCERTGIHHAVGTNGVTAVMEVRA